MNTVTLDRYISMSYTGFTRRNNDIRICVAASQEYVNTVCA